jgi:cytochrome oxidase assembly protein ShyY1
VLDHARTAGGARWVALTGFALVLLVVFLLLGRWQLHRAAWQSAADEQQAQAFAAATVSVGKLVGAGVPLPAVDEWRSVTATGTYDVAHQVLVRNRTLNSSNGYLVAVPLRTPGGDLLVVRGWIPSGATAQAPDAVPAVPTGTVTVTGRIRAPEPASANAGLPAGQAERIVPAEVAALTGRPTYDGWLSLQTENPSPVSDTGLQTLPADGSSGWSWPISHTVYAVQWFIFAVIAVVGWFILLRRDVRDTTPAERPPTRV